MRAATRAALENAPEGAFLYCPECGAEYSATPGDYWYLPAEHVFECEHGEDPQDLADGTAPMFLATRYVEIRPV